MGLLLASSVGIGLFFASCSDFTDIEPKGKSLLTTTDQLELLLNQEYNTLMPYEQQNFINESYYCGIGNVETMKQSSEESHNKIITLWEENVPMSQRQQLNNNDLMYMGMYSVIGTVANPVLKNVDKATGNTADRDRIKAEALTLRAWYHYLLVNLYAKAYNASSAAQDAGIPYQTEQDDVLATSKQCTVKEVYDKIEQDIDAALALNALPTKAVNQQRVSLPFAYAVKAQVLMSLGRYDEAYAEAQKSLDINHDISDHNQMATSPYGTFVRTPLAQSEDLFATYAYAQTSAWSPEMLSLFEPGNVLINTYFSDGMYMAVMSGMPKEYKVMFDGMLTNQMIGINTPMYMEMGGESEFNTTGLTTVDNLLLQAECCIRKNDLDQAAELLNKVREKRIMPSAYTPLQLTSKAEAVKELERAVRCERVYSILGFVNLKRWNQEADWAVTLTRNINGTVYTLSPSSPLWVWPFPANDVAINPDLRQEVAAAAAQVKGKNKILK